MSNMKNPVIYLFFKSIVNHITVLTLSFLIIEFSMLNLSFAENQKKNCQINKVELHRMYNFLDKNSNRLDTLNTIHNNICLKVENGEMPIGAGNFIQNAFILRWSICRIKNINPQVSQELVKDGIPKPIARVFEDYCKYKYPYDESDWEESLINSAIWLRNELFCQTMRYISYSDSWIEILRPNDLDSVKQLERSAISICNDLRNENIDFAEAQYRWNNEFNWFNDHLPKEAARHYLKQLIEPMKKIIEYILEE